MMVVVSLPMIIIKPITIIIIQFCWSNFYQELTENMFVGSDDRINMLTMIVAAIIISAELVYHVWS